MWKLKVFSDEKNKNENELLIKKKLLALKAKIPEIKKLEVGININSSDQAYDVVLHSEFENEKALVIYQNHPEHMKVSELISKLKKERAVVDYIVE